MIKKEISIISPPEVLLSPCLKPQYTAQTWGELAIYTVQLRHAFTTCSEKITGINRFIQSSRAPKKEE